MTDQDSYIHLARPLPVVNVPPVHATTGPLSVLIHAQALFSILDHSLRRNADQDRVIGTLLGVRSEDGSEVEIRNCFAVGHNESQEQVEVDMDYHKTMLGLHLKANPKEVLVGWYATSPELNTFSALIQNFYASNGEGTFPHPAVHLTMSTVPGADIAIRTYISSAVGVNQDRIADSCLFVPVPYEIRYNDADRSGLELVAGAKNNEERTVSVMTDIHALERAIEDVLGMLDRVGHYVSKVIHGETAGSTAIGKFLMNTLALAPKVAPSDVERMFNTHIQDVLLISYLANTIRTQIDLSNRLASLTATATTTAAPVVPAAAAAAAPATVTAGGK